MGRRVKGTFVRRDDTSSDTYIEPVDTEALVVAVKEYLSEFDNDNPVPDYVLRRALRDRMRELVSDD